MGQGGGPGVMSIGKSGAQEIAGEMTGVKFKDVGGLDEVELELKEIIEFLKNPDRFTRLGAKLPKGVLMVGPPGTGKTLLAQATAGEAGVPFFSISGSDFVEMFVGVGASRVRDLFEQAKKKAPCIVFIDEIDAIGQSRSGVNAIGTNDEREQTLNQLLNEMDGFEPNQGVVIMAATNRPEVLDKALLRPGRFDRQIQVVLPTEAGRREILDIHTREVKLADEVDLTDLSKITAGFSGADLANLVNEAALLAVRHDHDAVTMDDFDLALERVIAGLQRKVTLKGEVRRKVAYHEGGHALVAYLQPDTDPVHKVSIIPTSKGALGYTLQMPDEDTYLLGKDELMQRMAVMLGGRAAELVVFDELSTGAANDLERVTQLARRMVTEFGMTEALGPVRYSGDPSMGGYLGRMGNLRQDISPETQKLIDSEIRRIVDEAQSRAVDLLREHADALHGVAEHLIEHEVVSGDQITEIAGEKPSEGA
jgi:cell division protease FtsH